MKVTKDVILDLLPVYLAGEASADTRSLVDEYIRQDPALAQHIRMLSEDSLASIAHDPLSPDIELRSLRRARALLGWQKWLFGFGITFTALSLSNEFSFEGARLVEFHFLIRDYPLQFGCFVLLALICWVSYFALRRRLQTAKSA
jgi:hypothetical protein